MLNGFGQPVLNGFGQPVLNGFGQPVLNGFGQSVLNGFGQSVLNGFGQSVLSALTWHVLLYDVLALVEDVPDTDEGDTHILTLSVPVVRVDRLTHHRETNSVTSHQQLSTSLL